MERFKISQERADSLVKEELVRKYNFHPDCEIGTYLKEDGQFGHYIRSTENYEQKRTQRWTDLSTGFYYFLLKASLEEKGYDDVTVRSKVTTKGSLKYEVYAQIATCRGYQKRK